MSESFPAPVDLNGQKISVRECTACDGPHADMPVTEFQRSNLPWTHWYTCPKTGDPVPLSLLMRDAEQGIEVSAKIVRNLIEAQLTGNYMAVVIRREGERLHLKRETYNFATNDFGRAVDLLRDDLQREIGPPQPQQPMADASDKITPLVNLFQQAPAPPSGN